MPFLPLIKWLAAAPAGFYQTTAGKDTAPGSELAATQTTRGGLDFSRSDNLKLLSFRSRRTGATANRRPENTVTSPRPWHPPLQASSWQRRNQPYWLLPAP